jgi:hypothetical protein
MTMGDGQGCTTLGMLLIPLNYTLKIIKMAKFTSCIFHPNEKVRS